MRFSLSEADALVEQQLADWAQRRGLTTGLLISVRPLAWQRLVDAAVSAAGGEPKREQLGGVIAFAGLRDLLDDEQKAAVARSIAHAILDALIEQGLTSAAVRTSLVTRDLLHAAAIQGSRQYFENWWKREGEAAEGRVRAAFGDEVAAAYFDLCNSEHAVARALAKALIVYADDRGADLGALLNVVLIADGRL